MGTYEPCVLGSDGNCTRWSHDHAADRPSVTDNARAEQSEMLVDAAAIPTALLAAGRAETTTEEWPRCKASRDGGCDRCHDEHGRHIPCRAETTTATNEDAARVLDDVIQHLRKIWSTGHDEAREVIDTAEELLAQALPRLLATARTRPTREELSTLILSFLKPPKHSGGSWTLNPDDAADAVLALLRGGDK